MEEQKNVHAIGTRACMHYFTVPTIVFGRYCKPHFNHEETDSEFISFVQGTQLVNMEAGLDSWQFIPFP